MEIIPADRFTFEELTEAYNQTRIDYLVPMPMNVARLREYVHSYDVRLANSYIVMRGDTMLGLGMLGFRHHRSWITRLGVLPSGRRQGVGQALMEVLVETSIQQQCRQIWLEVIKGNKPAHELFTKFGFHETRELIVARRAPGVKAKSIAELDLRRVTNLNHEDALILLAHRKKRPNWLNETESMYNLRNLSALLVELNNGGRGWVTYHAGLLQLTRIMVEVVAGDPVEVTATILHILHHRHKRQDAITENILDDDVWLGYQQAGYFDAFRRIEMVREL
ncbi:MAG: GNAT family N-acetyltransferase [Chloroflexota bacterium]